MGNPTIYYCSMTLISNMGRIWNSTYAGHFCLRRDCWAIVTDYGWQIDLVSFLTQTLWSQKTWLGFKELLVYVLLWKYY